MSVTYKKSTHTDKLETGVMGKMLIEVQGEDGESIWVKRFNTYSVLQNDALNYFPFRSWGTVIPSIGERYDLHDLRETYIIELHPEAFDEYVKVGIINEDGTIIAGKEELGEDNDIEQENL